MSTKVWNLMYVAGNPAMFTRITANASNPLTRAEALANAEKVAANGWRVWVEHHQDGRRLFESAQERAFKARAAAGPVIEFAQAKVPGYPTPRQK